MVHRIILSTVILALSLSPSQLQASPLKLISSFYPQPATTSSLKPIYLEIYPALTFPDFQATNLARWTASLPTDNGSSLENILAPQLPSVLLGASASPLTGTPAPAPAPLKPAQEAAIPKRVMALALNHLYAPYKRGGSLRTGRSTDCSGFVRHVYQNMQIELPHSSVAQAQLGKVAARTMDFSKLQVGDLLFFSRARSIDHVGIYAGEGMMIHASSSRRSVIVTDLRQAYYTQNFVVAKRFLGKP